MNEQLLAITPIDGRYKNQIENLSDYFSEHALIKNRVKVEVEYLIKIIHILFREDISKIRNIIDDFNITDSLDIKSIEKSTNHDVKSVEIFIREKLNEFGLEKYKEFVHFGLTYQDINSVSYNLMLKSFINEMYFHRLDILISSMENMSIKYENIPMLGRTHGQPASSTTIGKEIRVFIERIENMKKKIKFSAKFGGAVGNLNAHYIAYPKIEWVDAMTVFLHELGLERQTTTTQVEHYDNLAEIFDMTRRINTILLDFAKDMWGYISMEYFSQNVIEGEVGSSTMPHKVNPIDFENAEGNLGMANAMFGHFSEKLPISRFQRDLTDSTVMRNLGIPFSYTIIALNSLTKGINKLKINEEKIFNDLELNWVIVAEAVQTILRRENYPDAYDVVKKLTRGKRLTKTNFVEFIDSLDLSNEVKKELKDISPFNYTGKYK